MRIIVWGINYAPECIGIAPYNVALCEFLQARGHATEMVSTFSYYPAWRKQPEDSGRIYRTDLINGVSVHRCWHFVPPRVSAWKRILHEGSFVFTSTLRILTLPRAEVYVIVSPPLLLGAVGWLVGQTRRAPFVLHVQDMQPDAAVGLGMLRTGSFTKALYALESFAYRKAARVSGITRGMLESFRAKGVPETKLVYFPNAVALSDEACDVQRGDFRRRHGFADQEFIALYAGNLGVKQGLDVLIEAARLVRNNRIRIVLCGDGAQREALASRVRELGLPNVSMLPLQPERDYLSLLSDADLCFVTQQAGSGNSFFPSKLLGLLAQSKPLITVSNPASELAIALHEGKFGVNVAPGHPEELARLLDEIVDDPARLARFGAAGRKFVQQFEKNHVLESFVRELESLGRRQ